MSEYAKYSVRRGDKAALLDFVLESLKKCGCQVIHSSDPVTAPFRISFEDPAGERRGIIVYAFLANSRLTRNRPDDEHRFQVKYGGDDKRLHVLWQDPYLLYTTLFCGIDLQRRIFVGADPVLHSPTRFFISVEYKQHHVDAILKTGWHCWERDHRAQDDKPIEVLVGGTSTSFLRYIDLEREAVGEDQGHRMLLAERPAGLPRSGNILLPRAGAMPAPAHLHALAREFDMPESAVLDLIASARRLKMAVRGWVAEEHLVKRLVLVRGVKNCRRIDEEGGPDILLDFEGTSLTVECKNVLRKRTADQLARIDFQRTRASKSDPCSRYYSSRDFDVVAACLHAVTEAWDFRYVQSDRLDPHLRCRGKLSNNVKVDNRWSEDAAAVLRAAAA